MNICALCQEKEADKKNTHYLTDSIIRTCLNIDGSNKREDGFYFSFSTDSPYMEFNFQRGTSIDKLEDSLGRSATEREIKKAKQIPYSVNNVFCFDCENIFTQIETPFIEYILPLFRENDFTGLTRYEQDNKTCKMFFYLQIWRNSICEDIFALNQDTSEAIRILILNFDSVKNCDIPVFPIHVTYLQTTGGEKAYTANIVGCTDDRNPNVILFNDFVIQFFESNQAIRKLDFYGLNEYEDFSELINLDNESFKFKIFSNEERLEIIRNIHRKEHVEKAMLNAIDKFSIHWYKIFGRVPNHSLIKEYLNYITYGGFDILKYSEEILKEKTTGFILDKGGLEYSLQGN